MGRSSISMPSLSPWTYGRKTLTKEKKFCWPMVLKPVSTLLMIFSTTTILPIIAGHLCQENSVKNFSSIGVIAFLAGLITRLLTPQNNTPLRPKESFVLVALTWILISFISALPLYFCNLSIPLIDCFFQSVSSLTATGLSTITKSLPLSMVFWKLFLQWLGGLGIIMIAGTILPSLNIPGAKIILTEFSESPEKTMPRFSQIILLIVTTYILLTGSCILCLWVSGMNIMDALAYGIAVSSTGGAVDNSYSLYQFNIFIKWTLTIFMFLAGSPLILLWQFFKGHWKKLFFNTQVLGYIKIYLISIIFFIIGSYFLNRPLHVANTAFSLSSLMSTTGLEIEPRLKNGPFSLFILVLGLIGGCAGSTAGGIKIYRLQVLLLLTKYYIKRFIRPHEFTTINYDKKSLHQSTIASIVVTCFLFIASLFVVAVFMNYNGLTPAESLELSFITLTNGGSLFWQDIQLSQITTSIKCLSMLSMILGRLEFYTVFLFVMLPFLKR